MDNGRFLAVFLMQILHHFAKLACPAITFLLRYRSIFLHILLQVFAADPVHHRIDAAVVSIKHIVDPRQVLVLQAFQDRRLIFLIDLVLILELCALDHNLNIHAFFVCCKHIACTAQLVQHTDIVIVRVCEPQYDILAHKIPPNFRSYSSGAASPESRAHTSIQSSVLDRRLP